MLLELHSKVHNTIQQNTSLNDAQFNDLALQIFEFQYNHNLIYKKLVDSRLKGETVKTWKDIPCVSTTLFKRVPVTCFSPETAEVVFHTSGTTESESGKHFLHKTDLYNAALVRTFQDYLLPDYCQVGKIKMIILTPSPKESPHSSLSFMMQSVKETFGTSNSGFYVQNNIIAYDSIIRELIMAQQKDSPVFLLGTAFSFAFLLEEMTHRKIHNFCLPQGSRIMETGGFKGRTKEIERSDFYPMLSHAFSIPHTHIVNEYGMTEISSQFYDRSLRDTIISDEKCGSTWSRIVIRNPLTLEESTEGIITIYDCANLYSQFAIATGDWGVKTDNGIKVVGRAPGEVLRGCSLNFEH